MKKKEIVVILHNIRSVHNVASIFRTADGAGVKKIYLCGITPGPMDRFGKILPQFAKVSLGAERSVSWDKTKVTSNRGQEIRKIIDRLKDDGYKIFAVEQAKGSAPYYRVRRQASHLRQGFGGQAGVKKVALIFGNEVGGLPPSILKKADKILEIPMLGRKESLNVSVAFGIVVYGILY